MTTKYRPILQNSIKSLKLGKSGGPDGLVADMIINTTNGISTILLPLFNKILTLGEYLGKLVTKYSLSHTQIRLNE